MAVSPCCSSAPTQRRILDEMLGLALGNTPTAIPGAAHLSAMNIDPDAAAEAYRARVLEQMNEANAAEQSTVRE